MAEKILIIGGTGYIGKFIVEASAKSGHPTFALLREATLSDPTKAQLIHSFKNSGVTILIGDLNDYESLVKAIKQVDVVISTVGFMQIADQHNIISAIKEAGNVKRFLPSEFGSDTDRCRAVDPINQNYQLRVKLRREIEAAGIPYTYVVCNFFSGFALSNFLQLGTTAPPREKVVIPGDGNVKAVFNEEGDIATYTIKTVVDPRTLNKILYIRPSQNIYSFNELVACWEKKIGKTLEKTYQPGDQILKMIPESPMPVNFLLAINHSAFIKGDQTYYEVNPTLGVEATQLYPDVNYTTVDDYLNRFL
ncbi:isoflavone reductase-like protein [Salvia hispanica]|uniref:isoflavone reductase-like protein n=1 Tax=Salvia hispanica TaxID=49212 RepID=UPI0020092848|nr:isoflavone reductase-like protein [Salvia hispanica]